MIVANDKQYLFEKMKVPKAVMCLVVQQKRYQPNYK